jgi:hypothetical protein
MLMKRRSLPDSSLICVESAGKVVSISAMRPGRLAASLVSCFRPSVWRTKAVGRMILMLMVLLLETVVRDSFSVVSA